MPVILTADQVWREIERRSFAVLGYVTPRGEARTVGIVYAVRDRRLYIATGRDSWKARHIQSNPHVSLTVLIPKRIPLLPWVQIPSATITFAGEASVEPVETTSPEILRALLRDLQDMPSNVRDQVCTIRIIPKGQFLTYGVGVSLRTMRKPEAARGSAPV